MTDQPPFDLATLDPDERAAWFDGYAWGLVHGAAQAQATQSQAFDAIARRYFRIIKLHEEFDRETRPVLRRPDLDVFRRCRADTSTARPVPTPEQCMASWRTAIADHTLGRSA